MSLLNKPESDEPLYLVFIYCLYLKSNVGNNVDYEDVDLLPKEYTLVPILSNSL